MLFYHGKCTSMSAIINKKGSCLKMDNKNFKIKEKTSKRANLTKYSTFMALIGTGVSTCDISWRS